VTATAVATEKSRTYNRDPSGRFASDDSGGSSPIRSVSELRAALKDLPRTPSITRRVTDLAGHRAHADAFAAVIDPTARGTLYSWMQGDHAAIGALARREPVPAGYDPRSIARSLQELRNAVDLAEAVATHHRLAPRLLYRGLGTADPELVAKAMRVGKEIDLRGPTSWSVNPRVATGFAKPGTAKFSVVYEVRTAHGLSIPTAIKPRYSHQVESILMDRIYRVTKTAVFRSQGSDVLLVSLRGGDETMKAQNDPVGTTLSVATAALGDLGEETYVIERDFWRPDDDILATIDDIQGPWFLEVPCIGELVDIAKRARTILTSSLAPGAVFATSEPVIASDAVSILSEVTGTQATAAEQATVAKALSQVRIAKTGEERYVLGIVLEPDTVDSQGDFYSEEDVRKAAHSYMEHHTQLGLQHREIVTGQLKILESFLAPADLQIDNHVVRKGTWLMGIRVVDDGLWTRTKKGDFTGFSIGGSAYRKPEIYVAKDDRIYHRDDRGQFASTDSGAGDKFREPQQADRYDVIPRRPSEAEQESWKQGEAYTESVITPEERSALRSYQAGGFGGIRNADAGRNAAGSAAEDAQLINDAIKKVESGPARTPVQLYRGMAVQEGFLKQVATGRVNMDSMSSWSRGPGTAEEFSKGGGAGATPVVLKLKSSKGLPLPFSITDQSEGEVIMPKRSYRVASYVTIQSADKRRRIHVVELEEEGN
jgi:hypothetical protein